MAESLTIEKNATKAEKYETLKPQLLALMQGETDRIANLANFVAALKETFDFLWVGFYLNRNRELVLGPFQGPVACTRIAFGKGVCGTVAASQKPLIVPDVEQFPGHIACSSLSRSEIVVPWMVEGKLAGVLDIDSEQLAAFDQVDEEALTEMLAFIP
jgi:GAF domain-containing protein